ncbi:hypothetical protein MTR_4g096910 [Medicago truncatula]|uniref:Uncharacterized protein n=1 Tax=Medicago truncatula TaxID=3880 RepID=G7JE09_MEDTR|nr:hypothetical protein MTR_4g096910 [Medicago truncatula]
MELHSNDSFVAPYLLHQCVRTPQHYQLKMNHDYTLPAKTIPVELNIKNTITQLKNSDRTENRLQELNMQMIEAMNDTKQLQMKSRGVGYMKSIVRGGAL